MSAPALPGRCRCVPSRGGRDAHSPPAATARDTPPCPWDTPAPTTTRSDTHTDRLLHSTYPHLDNAALWCTQASPTPRLGGATQSAAGRGSWDCSRRGAQMAPPTTECIMSSCGPCMAACGRRVAAGRSVGGTRRREAWAPLHPPSPHVVPCTCTTQALVGPLA